MAGPFLGFYRVSGFFDSHALDVGWERGVVTIRINGGDREVPDGLSLAELVDWLKLPRDRVAVERNLEIVRRPHWEETRIQAGDRLEVVHLVGGGM